MEHAGRKAFTLYVLIRFSYRIDARTNAPIQEGIANKMRKPQ